MRALFGARVWAGPIVYLIALVGTWLLANESARPRAVLLLVAAAMLAVVLWGRQNWIPAFPSDAIARTRVNRSCLFLQRTFAMPRRQLRRLGSQVSYGSQAWPCCFALLSSAHIHYGVFPVHHAFRVGQRGKWRFWPCCSSWRCSVEFGT